MCNIVAYFDTNVLKTHVLARVDKTLLKQVLPTSHLLFKYYQNNHTNPGMKSGKLSLFYMRHPPIRLYGTSYLENTLLIT